MSIVRRIMNENSVLRAENSAMRRMLEYIIGDNDDLRDEAVVEAVNFLGKNDIEDRGSNHG